MDTKTCTACGETKPVSEFYVKDKATGRPMSRCKPCHNAVTLRRYYDVKAGQPPKPARTEKRCVRCGETKPLTEFSRKGGNQGWRSACKPCRAADFAAQRAADPSARRAQDARYRERHAEELQERQRRWREQHPESYRAIHSAWKRANPDAVNASTHRRRSTLNGVGSFTAAEWAELKARYDHRCLSCRRQEPEITLTIDHVRPLSRGGLNTIENIQPLCKSCNSRKHRGTVDFRLAWEGNN